MMRKVKVKGPKKSSTLKRMNINLYGDNVTTPKLELPTAQFGKGILGRTAQPDPGSIRSTTKTSAIEEAKARQEAKDQGLGKTIGLGAAGFLTGALSSIPIIGGAFEGLNEKVQEKDKSGAAGIASGIGKAAIGTTSAVLSGGTMGVGEISEGVGDIMEGSSEVAYTRGNDQKSERLGKAGQAFDTIAPIADMASGFIGGGAEGAAGMFEGPEGFKGGMKSLLGGMPTAKFGTKLPLEMELMPENGMMVDGYSHEEGGVITEYGGKPVAEIEGGEGITKDGVVFSDTTINPETGKPFSKDAKKLIKSKDNSKEGENTSRLAEEELYIKQEIAKRMQGLENRGEDMRKYKKGGSLKVKLSDKGDKEIIKIKNKGLLQLPESGRKMLDGNVIDPTITPESKVMYNFFGSQNMQPLTPSNKSVPVPNFKGMPSDKDIFSYGAKGEDAGTLGKEVITGEKDFTKSQIRDINKSTRKGPTGRTQMSYMKKGGGLWANIHAKRKRGEAPAKPGDPDYPDTEQWKRNTAMYGKKLNLPKMQDGNKIPKKQLKTLRDQVSSGSLTFANEADFSEANMKTLTGSTAGRMKVPTSTTSLKSKTPDYEPGSPSLQGDIYSKTEKTATGKPALKTLGERLFRNADGSLNYNNKELRGGEREDREKEEGTGRGNLTPGDRTQLAGNMIAPLANLAAMRSIRENTVDLGRDRSITTEQRVSTADAERAARQEGAATRAGLTAMRNDAMKSAISTGTTKTIQDAILQGERINREFAMRTEQARTQRSQFNVGQEDKEARDKQTRKDLATTTGLTGSEQIGKALVDLGLTENQGLTNAAQLKVLKEAFPDFTITQDNMKSFIRDLSTGKEERILKYRT